MFFQNLIFVLSALFLSNAIYGQSGNKVSIASASDWVKHFDPKLEAQPEEGQIEGTYYLLIDKQINIVESERYFRSAYRIMTIDGLQQEADLTVDFDPTYERLVFHQAAIIRNGERINQLHPVAIKVVQREQQMDRHLYNGALTAIIHLTDLRIGDVVEYSFTKKGVNPVYDGHFSEELYFQYSVPYEQGYYRVISPADKKLRFLYPNGELPPTTSTIGNVINTWEFRKMDPVQYENNTPGWYSSNLKVMITDFESWDDLLPWARKYYKLNTRQVQKLKTEVGDYFLGENKQATALKIIRFIQDEVRYLGFEDGMHSHKPHSPAQVFQQRFGDCKDKSMLLCALLACYGIEANPVIVNSELGEHVESHMPAITSFNHVVTQIIADGDTIYVDPTISNQGGTFTNIYFPDYGKGFVVHPAHGGMQDISVKGISKIIEVSDFNLDAVGGGSGLMLITTYYGADADRTRAQFAGSSLDQMNESYLNYYANLFPSIETEFPVKVSDNRDENIFETTEYYRIPQIWNNDNEGLTTYFHAAGLEGYVNIAKSHTRRTTPYQLNYPTTHVVETKIRVPEMWEVEENEILIHEPEYSYSYRTSYSNQEILLEYEYRTLKSFIPVEKIETFLNDHERISNHLSFQLTSGANYVSDANGVATPALILSILTLLAGLWPMVLLYRYDIPPNSEPEIQTDARPIGGWLILFSFGIVLTPIVLLYHVFIDDLFFDPANWGGFMQSGNISNSLFMSIQLIYNLILLLFSIVLAVLFFQRRSSVPQLVVIRFLGNFFITLFIMAFGSALVEGVEYNKRDLMDILMIFIGAAIWVPYFLVSKHVKATFIMRLSPPQLEETVHNPDLIWGVKEEESN